MAELTFQSPGVSVREIDLSGPTQISPSGIPAGVIGTAVRGPAFVPVTVATFQDFIATFGATDGEKFGPLAMNEWLANARAGTYVRILGVGDGKKRDTSTGYVTNAGFVVGDRLVQGNGQLGNNDKAFHGTSTSTEADTLLGRTYFLGAFMADATSSTFLADAGIVGAPASSATAVDAIDTTAVANDTLLQFFVPAGAGGETNNSGVTEIFLDADQTTDPVEANNRIAIGISGLSDESIAADIIDAINGVVNSVVDPASGENGQVTGGTSAASGVKGIIASAGTSATKITLTVNTVGDVGNTATVTDTGTGAHNIVDLGAFSGGSDADVAHPILRGVVMVPSGVRLGLSSSFNTNNTVSTTNSVRGEYGTGKDAGSNLGDVVLENGAQDFVMLLNGHKVSATSGNSVRASFDPRSANYFPKVFNTDPNKIEEFGHLLYASYDIDPQFAVVTGSGVTPESRTGFSSENNGVKQDTVAFLLTGSAGRNTGTTSTATTIGLPNYDNFANRFQTAFSPFVISQKFGGRNKNLFRFHALDDGAVGAGAYKISIEEIAASNDPKNKYGSFRVLVRAFGDTDENRVVLETFNNVNLDPTSDRYVGRIIGDQHVFFDFDKGEGRQKLVIDGLYPNRSRFVRVEVSDSVEDGGVDATALPVGFRGIHHLVTSGSTTGSSLLTGSLVGTAIGTLGITTDQLKRVTQPPVPFRESLVKGVSPKFEAKSALNWGVQWELKDNLSEPNRHTTKVDPTIANLVKYFSDHHKGSQTPWVGANDGTADIDGTILDADRFNNNLFTLERVEVITGSNDRPDPQQWVAARYRRNASQSALTDKDSVTRDADASRFIDAAKDFDHQPSRRYLKFTFPLQGGFDGVNIFDKEKSNFRDAAVRREMGDAGQGITNGPTVAAYRKAIDVMESKSDVDIQLLAIPGIRHESVSDFAIDAIERRFDAMLIMDVEEQDELATFVTASSDTIVNVGNTTTAFLNRALDSSFAAAYFPDVVVTDPATGQNVQAPPSVAVLGAFSLNDRLAHPWFAPAGFTRGALDSVLETKVKLNRANLDELYSADINPLVAFPGQNGPIVFGQKTLLAAASALDRVNVRRLLIDVRRKVKAVANTLLFEPNRESTLAAFSAAVDPILATIQAQQGIDRFKVTIDTTTTTQTDVENNTIRGKIFLQPTRAVEFISLDFVVTNAGNDV